MEDGKFMVRVICMTYNHSAYIEDAMNGFCMQDTVFPYVCTIVDDASSDDEQEVIKNYLQEHFNLEDKSVARNEETNDYVLTFAQHKTNKNCYFAVLFLKYNHYSIKESKEPYLTEWNNTKYVALCEGDDYWIDPLKLQKQVDFMESHPKHSLCFCAHQRLLPSGESIIKKCYESNLVICPMRDVILGGGGYMATASMLYRKSLYVPYQSWAIGCPIGDGPIMLSLAHMGPVGYLSDIMCVYRVSAMGSWSSRMASDVKNRRKHYHAILRMWNQFDVWSNRKYHKIISQKKNKNRINHWKDEIITLINKILQR